MQRLHFEDLPSGTELPTASLTVEAEDAAFFAETFAPGAPWPEAPGDGPAPLAGFHVAALGMRLLFDSVIGRTAALGAPGIDAVTWPNPVRPGDVLRLAGRVEAARPSASRPDMGLVSVAFAVFNQEGALVMTQRNVVMVRRRQADPESSGAEG